MLVDFYQLGQIPADTVVSSLAQRLLANDERLLVVSTDEAALARLDRVLWSDDALTFLPHGVAGGSDDARQPVLLSTSEDSPNQARNMLILDGQWRDSALTYDRAFFLFADADIPAARLAWKLLSGREGVERRYWANVDGKWINKA